MRRTSTKLPSQTQNNLVQQVQQQQQNVNFYKQPPPPQMPNATTGLRAPTQFQQASPSGKQQMQFGQSGLKPPGSFN